MDLTIAAVALLISTVLVVDWSADVQAIVMLGS